MHKKIKKYFKTFTLTATVAMAFNIAQANAKLIEQQYDGTTKEITTKLDTTVSEEGNIKVYATNVISDQKYTIYRSTTGGDDYVKIGDAEDSFYSSYYEESSLLYTDYNAVPGVTYYYKIQPYELENGIQIPGEMSEAITGTTTADGTDITASLPKHETIKLQWYNMYNYFGTYKYNVYRAQKGDTSFTLVKSLTNKYEWTDKTVKFGETYYYKIESVSESDNSSYSDTCMISCTFTQTEISHKTTSPTKMKITWSKVPNANGYMVYLRKPGKTEFKYYKSCGSSKRNFTMKVKNGQQYGIKIIAYGTINGDKLLGAETIYEPYGDYYGYRYESYESKENRVYKGFKKSTSWSVIDKRMTTIKIKVWDFKSGMKGPKVTKTKYLTCHKRLAPTLKKIFDEIYKGKEKAPIYEVGGYSRRSGEHGNGMAVDINSYYNAMFDGKKATAGKYWNPKKYAYSIKRYGDIENAFEKYGFSRGFWGNRADYMHFSYFGT